MINNQIRINLKNSYICFDIEDLTKKQLIKNMIGNIKENELQKNNLDLDYEEIIEYQLKMILEIAKNSDKKIYICIDNYLTDNLIKIIKECQESNVCFLILNNLTGFDVDEYFLVNKKCIDCYDKNILYEYLIDNINYFVDKNEIDTIINDYINNSCSKKIDSLKENI